jgi:diguanylate cyclase (GGDEF)-like protein
MGAKRDIAGRRKDGTEFPVDISLSKLITVEGPLVTAVVRDISDRVRAERELRRINRTLRLLSQCNETLVRASDSAELLEAACRQVVEIGGYCLAWVGLVLQDEAKSVRPVARAGDDEGWVDRLQLTWGEGDDEHCPIGRAIREGRPVVVRTGEQGTDCDLCRAAAVPSGFAASISLPLLAKGKTLGVLDIRSIDAEAFDAEEVALLTELADDLAFGIHSLRETEAREHVEHELAYRINYDAVTGLPNRNLLLDRLEHTILHCARNRLVAAVLVLDLDRFKVVNDSLGHAVGDELLKQVGNRLRTALRQDDTVARLSADQFAVVLGLGEGADGNEVAGVSGKLLNALTPPIALAGSPIVVSASVGIALYPRDGEEAEELLRHAGTAMDSAKSSGGNGLRFYAREMNERLSLRLALETELRRAIERDEFVLHYQPRVHLGSGLVVGAEALVRWQHPTRGMVPPQEFISIAEDSGLILPLGEWVTDTACRQIRAWLDMGIDVPPVAVNLSAKQFRQRDLAHRIKSALDAWDLEAKSLELEITEGTAMSDLEATQSTLRQLKDLGLALSLDDFGTGYSSLAYLKRFPINHLKIDRTFVKDLTTDPDDAAICIAVIGLAHSLKLTVIAEGVETEGQMNYLRRHGCDEIQGYYFSKPLPAELFARLLTEWIPPQLTAPGESGQTLLAVDDEPNILNAIKRLLRRDGYRVLTASSADEAFNVLATNDVQVILSDQRMPQMSGTEFLSRVRDLYPDTIRIVLSGYTDLNTITEAVNRGAIYKFLTKPWDDDALRQQVNEAFLHYGARRASI